MTVTWTPTSEVSTTWAGQIIDTFADVIYSSIFNYDEDFLVYDGDYITGETDWLGVGLPSTVWSSI